MTPKADKERQEACVHALCKCVSHEGAAAAALVQAGAVPASARLIDSPEPDIQVRCAHILALQCLAINGCQRVSLTAIVPLHIRSVPSLL